MNLIRTIAFFLLLASGLGAAAQSASPADHYVMRHLQKGIGEDPGLSEEGRRNADRLATRTLWQVRMRGVRGPTAIYVSKTRRAWETAAPLAARLGIKLKQYEPMDIAGLVENVMRESGPVLIVGHSNTVPEIVSRLGGTRPGAIPETQYGDIWRVWGSPPRRTTRIRPFY